MYIYNTKWFMEEAKEESMRKRTYGRRTTTKSSKEGLTKTERTQTRQIAKSVVNKMAESKYFNTSRDIGELALNAAWWTSATVQSEIGVLGFTTGFEKQVDAAGSTQAYKYLSLIHISEPTRPY